MNKQICIIIFLLTCRICNAQNLVPNPSFEQYTSCPTGVGQLDSVTDWTNPVYPSSPDYYNVCGVSGLSVPSNFAGYEPAQSGGGYTGIVTFTFNYFVNHETYYREYMQTELIDTLEAGKDYFIRFYVSAGDSMRWVSNNIGVYFSPTETKDTSTNGESILFLTPQFENPITNNLNSKVGWTSVKGKYTATGGEKFIIIGNFRDTASSTATFTGWSSNFYINNHAYYYIDDVCISTDSLTCNSSVGINEENKEDELIFFPNPFTDKLNITLKTNEPVVVSLYDVTSRKIFNQSFTNSTTINTAQLAKGIYLYEVRNKSGVIKKGKVVKN